ncbi:NB-ARC domain-containing protein, partial [Streptomyces buecherae]|uniref:NB-ARC domain-containing protein n=1 Tax=Streptomyces buecherae TaxID=2763006 RepID=UPI00365F71CD
MLLAVLGTAVALLLALAATPATNTPHWPGPLDHLREHPWAWVGVLGVLSVVIGVATLMNAASPAEEDAHPLLPAVPPWFVDRGQAREAVDEVRRSTGEVGITTSLSGAGGFGKTTLAVAVAAHPRVRRRFRSRVYLFTIGRDVRGRAAVAAKVSQITRYVTGDTNEFDDPLTAGTHLARLLESRPRTLLVLDDVWEEEQLVPFLHVGRKCVVLVTTRNPKLLSPTARTIQVDQMSWEQAKNLLLYDLPPLRDDLVDGLLHITGRWALLLRLTNRLIAEQTATGADPDVAAGQVLDQLRNHGPKAAVNPTVISATEWSLDDPVQRNHAVQASIEAATTLLPPGDAERFVELGIFAEDESIPVAVVAQLWQATGALTEYASRALLAKLHRLSLLSLNDASDGGRISLHDVIRDYIRRELGKAELTRVNGLLIDAVATTLPTAQPLAPTGPDPQRAWWQVRHGYLLDHLIDHLIAAGRTASAEAVAGDVRWVETRLHQRGPTAPSADLSLIDTPRARLLARSIVQTAHLLSPTDPARSLTSVLHSHLGAHPHWHPQTEARRNDPALRPFLAPRWPLPDTPSPALQRTLTGHAGPVSSVAISADGAWLATTSDDGAARIWDVAGNCTAILTGHSGFVESVAISPDGTWLATTSDDGTARIWDVAGNCTATLTGHTGPVSSVAISPDGTWLATTSDDGTARIWDVAGNCTAT